MKIGILTFHWATNYGAILQCYALQSYLENLGYDVKVINYKPAQYEMSTYNFFRYRKFLHIGEFINTRRKEKALSQFRNNYLKQTERIYTCSSVADVAAQFDLIISGSDQVTNPFFLMNGEGPNIISPTYFLGFPFTGKRIGYALSFGCVSYPEKAKEVASKYIGAFDCISVRESTGVDIVKSMGRNDAEVVPDPTLLMDSDFYHRLTLESLSPLPNNYVYSFFIRHITDRRPAINKAFANCKLLWNNEDGDYTMQGWLNKIKCSEFVITDSFHCVVMCLKLHKPFIVVTDREGNAGMNDRLYTLLGSMGLEHRIVYKGNLCSIFPDNYSRINWKKTEVNLTKLQKSGCLFLNDIL